MKAIIVLVFLLFIANLSCAQQKEVTLLRQALQNHLQEDTTKIRLLTELAWWRYYFNQDTALVLLNQALTIAEKLKDDKAIGLTNREYIYYYGYCTKNYDRALIYGQKALQSIEKSKDKLQGLLTLSDIGHLYDLKNQYQEALSYYFKTLEGFEALKNQEYITYTLLDIKVAYEKMGNKEKGAEFAEKLNLAIGKINDKRQLARMLFCMTIADFWKFQYNKALDNCFKSEKMYKEIGDIKRLRLVTTFIAFTYHAVAKSYNDDLSVTKTIDYSEKVLNLIEKDNQEAFNPIAFQDKHIAYYNLAWGGLGMISGAENVIVNNCAGWVLSFNNRDTEKAKEYHLKAKALAEKEQDKWGLNLSIDGLAQIYMRQGNYQEALDLFLQILDENVTGLQRVYFAQCYQKLGKPREGLRYALAAEKEFIQTKNYAWYSIINEVLAEIYADLKQYENAYVYQKRAKILNDTLKIQENLQKITALEKQKEIAILEKNKQLQAEENKNQRLWLFSASGAFLSAIILAFVLYRNNQNKQKANKLLQDKNEEITQQSQVLQDKNRELEIEAALERVRSRAMAMQKSEELKYLTSIVSTELSKLDIVLDRSFIIIIEEKNLGMTWWMAHPETPLEPLGLFVQYHTHSPYLSFLKAWEERHLQWQYILEGETKKDWDSFLFYETEFRLLPEVVKINMMGQEKVYLSSSFNDFGCLCLATIAPLTAYQSDIMLRFAKVFDLTYTRFNDLKQAETQAKEAQIEAALERVRSRAMAMQKSNEVLNVAATLYEELQKLDFTFGIIGINLIDMETGDMENWTAGFGHENYPQSYRIPYFDHPFQKSMIEAWRNGASYLVYQLEGKEKNDYDDFMFSQSDYKAFPEEVKKRMIATESVSFYVAFMKHGALNWAPTPLSKEKALIFQRFAKVFEQTYTRFLDLQKAEEQAREAQIEAALEKIRSRALAMHRSDELEDVMLVMFERMKELDVATGSIAIQIFNTETKHCDFWVGSELQHIAKIKLPYDEKLFSEDTYLKDCWEAKAKGENIINKLYSFEQKNSYFDYVFANNDLETIPQPGREFMRQASNHLCNLIIEKNSALFADNWFGQYYSDDKLVVLKRVAKVFEQAYTRFLDLQKAEAQAEKAKLDFIQIQTEKKRAEDALLELQATQDQLIQSERLAVVGKLVANVAHEINTPLGAIRASAGNIAMDLKESITELPKIFDMLDNEKKILFFGLVEKALSNKQLASSKEERQIRKAQQTVLEEVGVPNADEIAYELSSMGLYEGYLDFVLLFKDENAHSIIKTAYFLVNQQRSTENIQVAVDRASKVVFALKTYARQDHLGEKVQATLKNGVETVLTLYHNLLKQGVEVIKDYQANPEIWCYPDELSQVWTNLIHNALQAMNHKGKLTVSMRQIEQNLIISFTDTGKGIPEEIKPKIFEPFFTTKPAGEGSGLGLDICQKIIKKHQGTIGFESEVGRGTTFLVSLPM
jgi:signal transduction histidine kinase/tetratricopeptide (TPR) repeat protein